MLFNVFMTFGYANVCVQLCQNEKNKVVLWEKGAPNRPKAPARYHVGCTYSIGYMEFSFPPYVSSMRVEISEGGVAIWEGNVTPDAPAIDIPILSGEYTVTCITDGGKEYSGNVYFDDETE